MSSLESGRSTAAVTDQSEQEDDQGIAIGDPPRGQGSDYVRPEELDEGVEDEDGRPPSQRSMSPPVSSTDSSVDDDDHSLTIVDTSPLSTLITRPQQTLAWTTTSP